MKIYIARHGRTNYNDAGFCNADPSVDVHLTEVGTGQVHELAGKLKDVAIDHVFVSELKRTQQTADIVNTFHGVPVIIDARLNDNRSGFEGRHDREYYAALDAADDKWTARFNGGESLEDARERVGNFLSELKTKDYDAVLIVTSMIIVQAICGVVDGLSNQETWDLEVGTASYMTLNLR